MIDKILKDTARRMDQSILHTQGELNKVRTGRANPEMFNSITIDYYGNKTPLNQLATISVPESRVINIQPYEKTLIPIIEKEIMDANMGFTPGNNGTSVIIPIPPLSEERRKELTRFVHKLIEEGRIAVRNVRRDAIHHLHDYGKDEHISEDEIKRRDNDIQKLTDDHISNLNKLQEEKEKDIMEI
ncbi:MAG: ribosome recycling factor [Candidatus Marinimicrobia bacterium]|nr:ribosome recycling factor [Candidatus Neomarinimicrobiota bacterium]|tara:strand:+ start:6958 stop:7515 length:558 start_codon:yes stop_codon:yes gene_type:complete